MDFVLTQPQLSYLASLIREDLRDGVMAWDTPDGTSLTREDIRNLCKTFESMQNIVPKLGPMPIHRLMLSLRAHNALLRQGIHFVGTVMTLSRDELLALEGIGESSAEEILTAIKRLEQDVKSLCCANPINLTYPCK